MATTMTDTIIVSESVFKHLTLIIADSDSPAAEALEMELGRADIVADADFPADVVTIGSTVTFKDKDTEEDTTVTLVYPQEASVDDMRISVLSPMGSALIGLAVGEEIEWPLPSGKKRKIRVTAVSQG